MDKLTYFHLNIIFVGAHGAKLYFKHQSNTYHKYKSLSRSKETRENNKQHNYLTNNNIFDGPLTKEIELFRGKGSSSIEALNSCQNILKEKSLRAIRGLCYLQAKLSPVWCSAVHKGQWTHLSESILKLGIHNKPTDQNQNIITITEECMRYDEFPPTSKKCKKNTIFYKNIQLIDS